MKQAVAKTEMRQFNVTRDEDSCSSTSNDYSGYPRSVKDPEYEDMDPESQNFLPDLQLRKKKYETEYSPGTTSFGMSVFNLGNAIMGSGILGLSYAMANTGILLFLVLLVAVSIFSLYSVHLLLKTANEGGIPRFIAPAMSSYLYIVKYELPIVFQALLGLKENSGEFYLNGDYLVLLISLIFILPLSLLRNLGYLGYTSGFSLLCMVFFLIVVIYKKFQISCSQLLEQDVVNVTLNTSLSQLSGQFQAHAGNTTGHGDDACVPKYVVINSQTVYAIPILTFAFVCHPAVLPMYEELEDRSRRKMQNVANVSFLAMFVMYLLAALFGYLTFNEMVEPELLHTYSRVYKFDVALLVVRLAVLTAVTLTVPVVLFPIRTSVNQLLCSPAEFSWLRHTIITVLLLGATNAFVILVPTIRDIFGFIGASAAAMLIFILPSAFYIKLVKKEPMKSVQKIGASIFLASGILVMVGSMSLIILDWIHTDSPQPDGH
uniref:Sodium-coupled neutral amino acid symporter 2 n=1 Tax=Paramormyrops kingsleyae TaxID=1676925 RepID=A0A3B3QY04_9TELE